MRCSFCHDRLESSKARRCGDCGTGLHPECWTEARGCTTLGCATRLAPAPRSANGPRPPRTAAPPLALVAFAAVVSCILGGAAWEGSSHATEERAHASARQDAEEAWRRAERAALDEEDLRYQAMHATRTVESEPAVPAVEPTTPAVAPVASRPPEDTHMVYGPPNPR